MRNVAKASLVCMMAGADFIKTSTGKESVNANLDNSLVDKFAPKIVEGTKRLKAWVEST